MNKSIVKEGKFNNDIKRENSTGNLSVINTAYFI